MADYDMEGQLAQLRLKQAYENQQQAQQPSQGRMAGQVYLAGNPIAQALRGYQANKDIEGASQQIKDLGEKRQQMRNQAMADFLRTSQDQPAFEAAGPAPQGAPQEGGYTVPAQKGNLMRAFSGLMNSSDPLYQQTGMKGVIELPQIQMQEKAKADALARQEAADKERERHNRAMEASTIAAINQRQPHQAQIIQTDQGPMQLVNGKAEPILGANGVPIKGGSTRPPSAEYQKQSLALLNVHDAANNYANKLETMKPQDMLNPTKRAEMGTAYNNMMLQAKEMFNLGVLNGPDMKIMTEVVNNPMDFSTAVTPTKAMMQQARDLQGIVQRNSKNLAKIHNQPELQFENQKPQLGGQDAAAMEWAKANPNDPRSAQILKRLGGQ